ncbi:hypothetical protein VCRA2116O30_500012 [Vibrio crassostreae]|nr:hypothetical protein VCRA2117O37_1020001 [Vibrio crassostreae]CAK1727878.1 hypothetical protein VCRA2117O39_1200001 [Vibrio crassostreae]CAK1734300.1 hypothetical protein VCRA2119O45_1230001 [Vibrio crassostreae]CAK2062176.1 hypothetical protein VCRA2117O40_360002 [Vibrio crassostreae]CAK2064994.1 hypothetical protein VCRA2116O28_380003 [Vibrio crassostreae]
MAWAKAQTTHSQSHRLFIPRDEVLCVLNVDGECYEDAWTRLLPSPAR